MDSNWKHFQAEDDIDLRIPGSFLLLSSLLAKQKKGLPPILKDLLLQVMISFCT